MVDELKFLMEWYASNCDGDWEHQYGVKINTIDNPGWMVVIDLSDTEWEEVKIDWKLIEVNDEDWYGYSVENKQFHSAGSPANLPTMLGKFKNLVEGNLE